MARTENVIVGPNGEVIARPQEVPTGLVSVVKAAVRALDDYILELQALLDACRRGEVESPRPTAASNEGAEQLGFILSWSLYLTNPTQDQAGGR